MVACANGHVEAVRLLLDREADVNAKDNVSTCDCTDFSVSRVSLCLCLVLLVYVLSLSMTIYTFRNVIIVMIFKLVMVGWGGVIGWSDRCY